MRFWTMVFAVALIAAPVHAADTVVHTIPPLAIGAHGIIDAHTMIASEDRLNDLVRRYEGDMAMEYWTAADGYRVTATMGSYAGYGGDDNHRLDGPAEVAMERMKAASFPMTFTTDGRMTPRQIENWDEVKAKIDKAIPEAAHAAAAADYGADEAAYRDDLGRQYGHLTQSDMVERLSSQQGEVAPEFPPMVLNQPVNEPMELPWHRSMVKGRAVTTLTVWDEAARRAHIVTEFIPDPDSARATMGAFVRSRRPDDMSRADWDRLAKAAVMILTLRIDQDIDLATGLQTRVEVQTASGVKLADTPQVETSTHTVTTMALRSSDATPNPHP